MPLPHGLIAIIADYLITHQKTNSSNAQYVQF